MTELKLVVDATMLRQQVDALMVEVVKGLAKQRVEMVEEVLAILDTGANMDIKIAQIKALAEDVPNNTKTYYAQPSQIIAYHDGPFDGNLVLRTVQQFPFTHPVKVRA